MPDPFIPCWFGAILHLILLSVGVGCTIAYLSNKINAFFKVEKQKAEKINEFQKKLAN